MTICHSVSSSCETEVHDCVYVQATIEALYLICQSVLYVCVLYFMAGFDKTPGKCLMTLLCF